MSEKIKIRAAVPEDADELLSIYRPYVEETAISFEYEVPAADIFRERIISTLSKYPYLVAQIHGEIAGYTYAGIFKDRPAYDWAVETSIFVKQDQRRMGIGKKLYEALEAALKEQGILNVYACIAYPESEDEYLTKDSVLFHEKLGYRLAGRFQNCGFKFDRWYHMVWMEKLIGEHQKQQMPIRSFADRRKY